MLRYHERYAAIHRLFRSILFLAASLLSAEFLSAVPAPAQSPVTLPLPGKALAGLKAAHPRLLVPEGGFPALKIRIQADAQLTAWYAKTKANADQLLAQPPSQYVIPDGLRLLATSRAVLDRVYTLALVYRMEGDAKYAERAWAELSAAAAFPDWNAARHFLDTGEMTHAFAIGYDWLFDYLTPERRTTLRKAMVDFGFQPGFNAYKTKAFWVNAKHNWNMVCNGGLAMGALAIGDEETPLADSLLSLALGSLAGSGSIEEFGPDGGWGEGPGYWGYAMQYLSTLLGGMQTALGTDYGLGKIPGLDQAGFFPIYTTGPTNKSFNYADAGEGPGGGPGMFLLAGLYHQPAFAGYQKDHSGGGVQELIWYSAGQTPKAAGLPLDRYFRHAEVTAMRSAWDDPLGAFAGFKAGDNKFNHSHLDLGSFVADAQGVRWAGSLGPDDYNMPGYFDTAKQRWTYYRLRAEGNNTFILNPGSGPDQEIAAATTITRFQSSPDEVFAVADLTAAYAKQAQKVSRGFALFHGRKWFMVQDEAQCAKPAEAWWFMHTKAVVELATDSVSATLTQSGKRMVARILSPAGAKFLVMDAKPLPTSPNPVVQNVNAGWRKLAIHLSGVTDVRLTVVLVPLAADENPPATWPLVPPLNKGWPSGAAGLREPRQGRFPDGRGTVSPAGAIVAGGLPQEFFRVDGRAVPLHPEAAPPTRP